MTRTGFRPLLLIAPLLPGLLAASGCSDDGSLVVATPWDRAACLAFEEELRAARPDSSPPIRWLRASAGVTPARLLSAGLGVDLLLGWPPTTLEDLRRQGMLSPADPDADPNPPWLPVSPPSGHPGASPAIADPRIDPDAGSAVALTLARGDWLADYAELIAAAAGASSSEPLGLRGGARAAGSDHPGVAAVLGFVAEHPPADDRDLITPVGLDSGASRLAAELVGATAIDAGPELRASWEALGRLPEAEAEMARLALAEPPPWPPASVQLLRADPDRRALLDTLASAIVRGDEARALLVDSWDRPPRPLDRASIVELAAIDGGRLLAEPHVLPWLRAEWTAWARQRYARIARDPVLVIEGSR